MQSPTTGVPASGSDSSSTDRWCLRQHQFQPAQAGVDGALFALGNGALGIGGGLEEEDAPAGGCFHAGVYDTQAIHYHERFPGYARRNNTRVPLADGRRLRLRLDGVPVDLASCRWLHFQRSLDLHTGVLHRTSRLVTAQGHQLTIDAQRLVAPQSDVLAVRYTIAVDRDCDVQLESCIALADAATTRNDDPRIGVAADSRLVLEASGANDHATWVLQHARGSDIGVACAQCHHPDPEWTAAPVQASDADALGLTRHFQLRARARQTYALEIFTGYAVGAAGAQRGSLVEQACASVQQARSTGFAALRSARARATAAFWDHANVDIDIETDPTTVLALRFNLFHLWQSASRDPRYGTAAKGLTGEGYEGHCFWDTEAFALPMMVFTAPQIARAMLGFRYAQLDAARAHARELNHPTGALFPWRTIAGNECSAHYPTGSAAYHINADIAYALGLYLDATDDVALLLEGGAELLFETARIWPQVGNFDSLRGDGFGIFGVTGPDEYTVLVNNNFYTNRMAQQHLRRAVAVWNRLRDIQPDALNALAKRLKLHENEVQHWHRIAQAMLLPIEPALGVFAQDDGFLHKPHWPHPIDGDGTRPLLLDCHPLTLYRHQVCKQADVVMALVLAGDGLDTAIKRRSFDYYEAITTHDSTLSPASHAIVASELGLQDKALGYFQAALRMDLDNRHSNTGHGVHMAAMAGSWLALTWGFGGMRVVDGELAFSPSLPPGWRGYAFTVQWRGSSLRVDVDKTGARYRLLSGPRQSVIDGDQRLHLSAPAQSRTDAPTVFPRPCQALIFDLDGVLTDTAQLHYHAWKRLADEIGVVFTANDNHRLKGVDRNASLEIILERATRRYSSAEKSALAARKNDYFQQLISEIGPEQLFLGVERLLRAARARGLRIALASSSRNATTIVRRLGIIGYFDTIVDAGAIARAKPAPDIFLAAAAALNVEPQACIGIEDAAAGIVALKAAQMPSVGIGDKDELAEADVVLPSIAAFALESFVAAPDTVSSATGATA